MKEVETVFYRIIIALTIGLFASCAAGVVATYPAGDVVIAEGQPPFAGAVWIGGEYRWVNHRYVLVGGHWSRPRAGRAWVAGRWAPAKGGYVWKRGHWH